jgi:hypothetical protein
MHLFFMPCSCVSFRIVALNGHEKAWLEILGFNISIDRGGVADPIVTSGGLYGMEVSEGDELHILIAIPPDSATTTSRPVVHGPTVIFIVGASG